MLDWLRRLLAMPQQPRKNELQIMLDHLHWQHERDMQVIDRMAGTLDRVVSGRFDRPQVAKEEIQPMRQQFTPDDLVDVLETRDDDEFFRKIDNLVQ